MNNFFTKFAKAVSDIFGSPAAILLLFLFLLVWAYLGPTFNFSSDWRDVVKLAAAILTLITTFLLRYNQNRDTKAMQIKLDELLRTKDEARTELINLENCSDDELDNLEKEFIAIKEKRGKIKN